MNNDWSFHPGVGLGRLRFGMTPEEVQAFEGIYGKVRREWKEPPPSEMMQKSMEKFLATLAPDAREKWIENDNRITEFREKKTEHHLEKGIELLYYEQRLYSISPANYCKEFNINGLLVFSSEPESVVLALAGLLKENPLVKGSDLVFRKSLVSVFGFTYGISKNGEPLYYTLEGTERDEEDTDFSTRGITWSTLPRNVNPEDWSRHVEVKLL